MKRPKKLLGLMFVVLAVAFVAQTFITRPQEKNMAITFNSSTSLVNGVPTTAHLISTPGAAAPGKVMVAYLLVGTNAAGSLPTITQPAGWSQLNQIGIAGTFKMYWGMKVATASEPPNYTWTTSLAVKSCHAILLYNDADTPLPDAHASLGDITVPLQAPAIITIAADAMVLRSAGAEGGAGTNAWTGFPSGSVRINLNMLTSADPEKEVTLAVVEEGIKVTPGNTGAATFTNTLGSDAALGTTSLSPGVVSGGGPGGEIGKKSITKVEVLAAREHAKAIGAKVKTKFDPRTRR